MRITLPTLTAVLMLLPATTLTPAPALASLSSPRPPRVTPESLTRRQAAAISRPALSHGENEPDPDNPGRVRRVLRLTPDTVMLLDGLRVGPEEFFEAGPEITIIEVAGDGITVTRIEGKTKKKE